MGISSPKRSPPTNIQRYEGVRLALIVDCLSRMVDKVFEEFSKVPRLNKAVKVDDFLRKALDTAAALSASARPYVKINAQKKLWTMNDAGGKLLGGFIRQNPEIVEIYLPNHQIVNTLKPDSLDGWNALLDALAETKSSGKLLTLDLSSIQYTPDMLRLLAEKVLHQHPSLRAVYLNTCQIEDDHLAAIEPFLEMPALQTLSLRSNRITGSDFATFVTRLRTSCPKLLMLDLTTNDELDEACFPFLEQWLDDNQELYIGITATKAPGVYERSVRNRYLNYNPPVLQQLEQAIVALLPVELLASAQPPPPPESS